MSDQALLHVDHRVRAVRAQPGHAVRSHRELHPSAPAQARRGVGVGIGVGVTGQRLDRHLAVDACHPPELLTDDGGLEEPLRRERGVLPVTAAAATRMRVRAGRLDPVR